MTQCATNQEEIGAPTATEDRQCRTVCAAGDYMTAPRVSNTDNTQCSPCPDGTFKPFKGNDVSCSACARGYKQATDRQSCFEHTCSHIMCRLETHKCAHRHHAKKHNAETCRGGSHHSIRVFHGHCGLGAPTFAKDCDETVCVEAHHCGMGFASGDKSKCECVPNKPLQP